VKPVCGRILIVDDEPLICELLRDVLTVEGYEVATAVTGAEALEAVPRFRPNVILVDMLMPGLSGRGVLHAVRRAGVTVPVILISGDSPARDEGFYGVITKPFDLITLGRVVAAAMDEGRTKDA
jgi:CheY-like chemotaxis protein